MKNKTITNLVQTAMSQLREDFNFTEGTLKGYEYQSFRPIEEYFKSHGAVQYDQKIIDELQADYEIQLEEGIISRKTFHRRYRGIGIITEIQEYGYFEWKVFRRAK